MDTTNDKTTTEKSLILAVDDNQMNLALLEVHLKKMGHEVVLAQSGARAIEIAKDQQPDLILLDIMMPEMDGYEACRILKGDAETADIPVIFLSAKDDALDKVAGLESGAVDYVTKPFEPVELKARIDVVLQMAAVQEKLEVRANTDELTNLPNRRRMTELLDREMLHSRSDNSELSIIVLDIDHFKSFNDTYGHLGGDVILKQLSRLLADNVRSLDVATRYGGEEFVVVMPKTSCSQAYAAAEKLRKIIEHKSWNISAEDVVVTVSMGVATFDAFSLPDPEQLIKQADKALYAAKAAGRNCVMRYDRLEDQEQDANQEIKDVRELHAKVMTLDRQVRQFASDAVNGMARALQIKDSNTMGHAERVARYAEALARQMNLPADMIERIILAARLHDLGKLGIPNEVINKQEPLTENEKELFRLHPVLAIKIVEPFASFKNLLPAIRSHHENFDGSGYPDGIARKHIPFEARVIAVADNLDAACSGHFSDCGMSLNDAVTLIADGAETLFDPDVVEAFLRLVCEHEQDWPLEIESPELMVPVPELA